MKLLHPILAVLTLLTSSAHALDALVPMETGVMRIEASASAKDELIQAMPDAQERDMRQGPDGRWHLLSQSDAVNEFYFLRISRYPTRSTMRYRIKLGPEGVSRLEKLTTSGDDLAILVAGELIEVRPSNSSIDELTITCPRSSSTCIPEMSRLTKRE